MAVVPRLLAVMGSGETAPTMGKVHRDLLSRLGRQPVPAVLLDTPFGFQANADDLAARAVDYFAQTVQAPLEVASYRSVDEVGTLEYETMLNRLRAARYVFAGPGSPSYALGQWRGTQVPEVLADKLRSGGCVTFASAAAVTLGPFALPVYELYKVGQAPHWLEGLDLMGSIGLPAVVVPHFDNAEGGTHDTRFCYMGERRLSLLEEMLPREVFILGVDEHTAAIFDLGAATVQVVGRGALTVRRRGAMARVEAGQAVAMAALAALAEGPAAVDGPAVTATRPPPAEAAPAAAESPLLANLARLQSDFDQAMAAGDARGAVKAALALDDLTVEWSRDTLQSDGLDQARAVLRSMVVRLGEAADDGVRDPRQVVGPFVDALLSARERAREERRWVEADFLRDRLVEAGIEVHDTPTGTNWELA
ncbi:MAG: CysS/YqeB C-terminal domain-containing protein [Acidimicrobiales bacterium]